MSDITLPSTVSSTALTLEGGSPHEISLSVGKLSKQPKQVKVVADVELSPGYMSQRLSQNYTEIVIEGPADLVDQVHYAQVLLERENVDQTITTSLPYVLIDYNGEPIKSDEITCDVSEIEVVLPVVMTKEVKLEVSFIDGGGATSMDVTVDIEPASITLSGDPVLLETINSIKLTNVALSNLMSNSETLTAAIPIPEGCASVSGETEAVIDLRLPGKSIKSLRATNIQIINAPVGVTPVSKTTVLWVSVRAAASQIDAISEENIRVVADLSGVTLPENGASVTVPVSLYVDSVEGAGVVGSYSIVVELSTETSGADE